MSHTFTRLRIHAVFSTKERLNLIRPGEMQEKLYNYVAGIIKTGNFGQLLRINGISDHVHMYIDIKPNGTISNMIKSIKTGSTKWVNQNYQSFTKFSWQTGYGAFSVSQSAENDVIRYIENQESHHKKMTFKEEYI